MRSLGVFGDSNMEIEYVAFFHYLPVKIRFIPPSLMLILRVLLMYMYTGIIQKNPDIVITLIINFNKSSYINPIIFSNQDFLTKCGEKIF